MDLVSDIFKRSIIWKLIQNLFDLFFWRHCFLLGGSYYRTRRRRFLM